jgi:hypothetical protein
MCVKLLHITLIVLLTTIMGIGCASRGGNPAVPPAGLSDSPKLEEADGHPANNHHIWGLWQISISEDRQVVEVVPARGGEMHLNVVRLLEITPCDHCLTISNLHLTGPNELEADLTLTHPFPGLLKYTGFDVRGIFIAQTDFTFPVSGRKIAWGDGVPRMLNPDGYTPLFNPTEFPQTTPAALGYIPGKHATGGDLSATLNPFVAYRKDAPRRMFETGGAETRTVKLYAPTGPIHFGYAVDACWQLVDDVIDPLTDFPPDANCLEACRMDVSIGAGLISEPGSQVPIQVEIYDHQGQETISTVTIEAPDLFAGEISLSFSTVTPNDAFLFTGTLTNDFGAADGEYPLLVEATDWVSDQNLGSIAAWQVSRAMVGEPRGWVRTWGGTKNEMGDAVATDPLGNAYVVGWFVGTVDFDPGPGVDNHDCLHSCDCFLSKFDSNGNFLWARTWGDFDWDEAESLAVDSSGNAYVAGYFMLTVDFDPGPGVDNHTSNGDRDAFLVKFGPNGDFMWARTWGGKEPESHNCITGGPSGSLYVSGYFEGTIDFDPGSGVDDHTSNGDVDAYLSSFDADGNFLWARTWGGTGMDVADSVASDLSDNVYVFGRFQDTVDFDPGPGIDNHTSNGDRDFYLSKFDSTGNFLWVRPWGGPDHGYGTSVATDSSGSVYLAGNFMGTADFDPGPGVDNRVSNGDKDAFLMRFDADGNFIWALTWGGAKDDSAESIATDPWGYVYATGSFDATVDLDPGPGVDNHTPFKDRDAFLSKFDSSGDFLFARTWGAVGYAEGKGVATDPSGSPFVMGTFSSGAVDFDPGPGEDNHSPVGKADTFLSKFLPDGNW